MLKSNSILTRLASLMLFASMLAGCSTVVGTTINTANRIEQSRVRSRLNDLVVSYLEWIKELQEKGDPMGDYLWTKANDDGLVENPIKDKIIIKQMYVDAALKGSVDAQILLGLKRFYEGSSRPRNDIGKDAEWLPNISIWQDGLKRIEQATQKQCWYYTTYIFTPRNKVCLTPMNVAKEIWPAFRDGITYPKDAALMNYWKAKRDACEAEPAYHEARRKCQPFGG